MKSYYYLLYIKTVRRDYTPNRLTTSIQKETPKETKDEEVQTNEEHRVDVQKKNLLNVQKSLEILDITDEGDNGIEVSFEKPNFAEEHDNYRTPNESFLEPLNEEMADQIDQLIAKLNDCKENGGN